jgi:hypothetical protein
MRCQCRIFLDKVWLLVGLSLWPLLSTALEPNCAAYLQRWTGGVRAVTVVARLQTNPQVLALRPRLATLGPYIAQAALLCDSEPRQQAWRQIWQTINDVYFLAHQVQAPPILILAAAGNLKWDALVRWQMFLAYAQVASLLGHADRVPTLAGLRTVWRELWPREVKRRPHQELVDFLALIPGIKGISAYLFWHPTKTLAQVLDALHLRQEIKDYLEQVAAPLGILRPPVVAGMLAQNNYFKNQIRLLRQAVHKQDQKAAQKRWLALQEGHGLSWLALMDEANLAPRALWRLWKQQAKSAAELAAD